MNVFIAYQSESRRAAEECKRALVAQGCAEGAVELWNPTEPWAEPIVEIGKRIMRSHILLVMTGRSRRRSSWVAAESRFSRRVGVPVHRVRDDAAGRISLEELSRVVARNGLRLIDKAPFMLGNVLGGFYFIQVHKELESLQFRAADRSRGPLAAARRYVHDYETAIPNIFALLSPAGLFHTFIHPGLICIFVLRPLVRLAERAGWLARIEPSDEFGTWEDRLPTFIGGHDPFFDDFGGMSWFFGGGDIEDEPSDEKHGEVEPPEREVGPG